MPGQVLRCLRTAIGVHHVVDGCQVAVITGAAGLGSDIGVVVIAVYIGTDTVAVGIADTGAGGGVPAQFVIAIHGIIDGGVVAIVAGTRQSEADNPGNHKPAECRRIQCTAGTPAPSKVSATLYPVPSIIRAIEPAEV